MDHAEINMYADDAELHCCGVNLQDVQSNLQSDLNHIHIWLNANRLQLNIFKFVIICYWAPGRNYEIGVQLY